MAVQTQNLVGNPIRKIRVRNKLSQDAASARCQSHGWDISRGTFAKIEAGLRRVNDGELVILAKVLRCAVTDLLAEVTLEDALAVARHGETSD